MSKENIDVRFAAVGKIANDAHKGIYELREKIAKLEEAVFPQPKPCGCDRDSFCRKCEPDNPRFIKPPCKTCNGTGTVMRQNQYGPLIGTCPDCAKKEPKCTCRPGRVGNEIVHSNDCECAPKTSCSHISGGLGACPKCGEPYADPQPERTLAQKYSEFCCSHLKYLEGKPCDKCQENARRAEEHYRPLIIKLEDEARDAKTDGFIAGKKSATEELRKKFEESIKYPPQFTFGGRVLISADDLRGRLFQ
jgi:hypothetical protein